MSRAKLSMEIHMPMHDVASSLIPFLPFWGGGVRLYGRVSPQLSTYPTAVKTPNFSDWFF